MEKQIKLKDGKTVLVRDLQRNEDVFGLMDFINELIEEKAFLSIDVIQTPESETAWLEGEMKKVEAGEELSWRVILDGKDVGGVSACAGSFSERGNIELGIALAKEVRGHGLGKQLLEMLIEETKKKWNPKNIYLTVYSENKRALSLYKSLGFKEFARFKNWFHHHGTYIDKVWLIL